MKFNPFDWSEVNEKGVEKSGRLWLRVSNDVRLYVSSKGYEALAGVGLEFDLKVQGEVEWRVEAVGKVSAEALRTFVYAPRSDTFKHDGETYTNLDKMPLESGSVLAVTKAVRQFRLEQRQTMIELKAARQRLRRERLAAKQAARPVEPPKPSEPPKPVVPPEPVKV